MNNQKIEQLLTSLRDNREAIPERNSFVRLMNSLPTQARPIHSSQSKWYRILIVGLVPSVLVLGTVFVGVLHIVLVQPPSTFPVVELSPEEEVTQEIAAGVDVDELLSVDAVSTDLPDTSPLRDELLM